MSMTPEDILYLRAELAQAQQAGVTSTMVRVSELQSLLDRLARAQAAAPPGVKIFGFIRPGEAKEFRQGGLPSIRVKRSITEWHTVPLFHGELVREVAS
jgi:hypothetical protein